MSVAFTNILLYACANHILKFRLSFLHFYIFWYSCFLFFLFKYELHPNTWLKQYKFCEDNNGLGKICQWLKLMRLQLQYCYGETGGRNRERPRKFWISQTGISNSKHKEIISPRRWEEGNDQTIDFPTSTCIAWHVCVNIHIYKHTGKRWYKW